VDSKKRLYTDREIAGFRDSDRKIFGHAASNTSTAVNINNQKGNYGELIIGNMLNLIACETPEFYVFHSVGLPLNLAGETDHVVLYRNKIILIETKAFSSYKILKVSQQGTLIGWKAENKNRFKVEDNKLFQKMDVYQKRFDNRKAQAVIAVVRDDIRTETLNDSYQVVTIDNFFKFIRDEMATAKPIKEAPWPAIKFFSMLCIKQSEARPLPAQPIKKK
jgi:Nuclease-related domain